MKHIALLLICAFLASAAAPTPLKIFIEPAAGFESYIAAAIVKKGTPVTVTTIRDEADYTISSAVITKDESGRSKLVRCVFLYCMGIEGIQTATIQMVGRDGIVAWAYNVRKASSSAYQSSAEAIAKHLKQWLAKSGPTK